MTKIFSVDAKLLAEAKTACGAKTETDTIRLGLEALVRHAAYQRVRSMLGSEAHARDVPRRREKPFPKITQPNSVFSIYERLRRMAGLLKEVYSELGGSENAIRKEREGYTR